MLTVIVVRPRQRLLKSKICSWVQEVEMEKRLIIKAVRMAKVKK